jgi:microsomal dipeptidase-like Zn-dependent dipeptidase
MKRFWFICLFFLFLGCLQAQPVREYMDLQVHPTMHEPYSFFGKGLQWINPQKPPKSSYKHLLRNVNHADYFCKNPGARIWVNGALNFEFAHSKRRSKRVILRQIQYINDFAAAHPDSFAVAKSPQEARDLIANTDKTIFIHSIEGGKRLINSQEDADFWASQGVAFITLVHLVDDLNGGAAIAPGVETHLINLRGLLRRKKKRHLTEHGRQAIIWMANAGIMTDITHMSGLTRKDAIDFMIANNLPVLSTHAGFAPVHKSDNAIPAEDVLRIYAHGGMVSLGVTGWSLLGKHGHPECRAALDSLPDYVDGSIDSYEFAYNQLKAWVEGNAAEILGRPGLRFEDLSEEEKEALAIGFETDFNGWTNHYAPVVGKDSKDHPAGDSLHAVEIQGLAHPGLLASHWECLAERGTDLQPILRSSERFLQLWQLYLDNKGTH